MHSRTIDVVTGWETVATPAGYEGLNQLADRGFSGAVSTGTAWAFFLNGRIVGTFEGDIRDFEDVDVTAYRAPDPSLPLLFAMQERGGETRANYYTNETPLRDVDGTLSNGGFTGYVELSENVLSGDYYVVYHGGKSMSVAFVGASERLVTGKEAFETAADEVGIYEVVDVDVDTIEIPEPAADDGGDGTDAASGDAGVDAASGDAGDHTAAGAAGGDPADPPDAAESERDGERPADDGGPGDPDAAPEAGGDASAAEDPADADPRAGADADRLSEDESGETEPNPDTDRDVRSEQGGDPDTGPESGNDAAAEADPDDGEGESPGRESAADAAAADPVAEGDDAPADPSVPGPDREMSSGVGGADAGRESAGRSAGEHPGAPGDADGALTDEERWQQARTIPSLDPEESTGGGEEGAENAGDREAARERAAQMQRQRRRRRAARDRTSRNEARESAGRSESEADSRVDREEFERLRQRLSDARDRVESLEAERDDLLAEREELMEERDGLRSERTERAERIEELEAECERLRSEVDRLQSRLDAGDGTTRASESMPPDRALSGTNLFVRYDSKGQATLNHAHGGSATRSDVRENLRLEHHTTFETGGVAVDDRPYEEFLRDSTEYAFAQWVVSDLLYEIGETGNRSGLAGLFDAIPDIDRVELRGEVGVETDDGVEQRAFDVVFRDRMGDPLFVADINPSRDATTEAMVGSLVENTHTVATEAETLAAGFYVTESFYEPGALETVADRTDGGLLSRSKKRSFVKLSRKRGYHLCLVEARGGEFHLNVPEL